MFLSEVCETSDILKIIYFINEIIKIAFIIVPIGLIIMIMVDFTKNVISKEEEMKKNLNMVIKRIIMCVAVFLVPTIVNVMIDIVDSVNINNFDDDIGLVTKIKMCKDNANLKTIEFWEKVEEDTKKLKKQEEEEKRNKKLQEEQKENNSNNTIIASNDSNSNASSNDNNSTNSNNNEDSNSNTVNDASERILQVAWDFTKQIKKDGDWKYRTGANFQKHINNHELTCCYFVTYILKKAGYAKGTICHANSGKRPSGYEKLKLDKVSIYTDVKLKDLKPGDVVVKNGSKKHNIAIFAYRKNNDYYFFSASDQSQVRKNCGPLKTAWWKNNGITAVIRAK